MYCILEMTLRIPTICLAMLCIRVSVVWISKVSRLERSCSVVVLILPVPLCSLSCWIILCSAPLMVKKEENCERRLVRLGCSLSRCLVWAASLKNNDSVSRLMNRVQDHPDCSHQTINY